MLFTVGKDEWNTKEGTSKSLKNTLHVLWYAKRHLSGWSDVEQGNNQGRSHSHYWVMLSWRHQSVRQSVRWKFSWINFSKFCGKLLKALRVDLKSCLGLVLSNATPASSKKIEASFRVIIFRGPCLLLGCPYYEPLLWFMIKAIYMIQFSKPHYIMAY